MDAYRTSTDPSQRASWIVCFARHVRHMVSEVNYASRRASALMLAYGLAETDQAPDTYAEFLLRSQRSTVGEPPARCRAGGGGAEAS